MLLTINNLPHSMTYGDIKNLLKDKCCLEEIILDNLSPDGYDHKKVTVGVSDEGDAAILVRKINGLYVQGCQLFVEDSRKKKKESEQPFHTSAMFQAPDVNLNRSMPYYMMQSNTAGRLNQFNTPANKEQSFISYPTQNSFMSNMQSNSYSQSSLNTPELSRSFGAYDQTPNQGNQNDYYEGSNYQQSYYEENLYNRRPSTSYEDKSSRSYQDKTSSRSYRDSHESRSHQSKSAPQLRKEPLLSLPHESNRSMNSRSNERASKRPRSPLPAPSRFHHNESTRFKIDRRFRDDGFAVQSNTQELSSVARLYPSTPSSQYTEEPRKMRRPPRVLTKNDTPKTLSKFNTWRGQAIAEISKSTLENVRDFVVTGPALKMLKTMIKDRFDNCCGKKILSPVQLVRNYRLMFRETTDRKFIGTLQEKLKKDDIILPLSKSDNLNTIPIDNKKPTTTDNVKNTPQIKLKPIEVNKPNGAEIPKAEAKTPAVKPKAKAQTPVVKPIKKLMPVLNPFAKDAVSIADPQHQLWKSKSGTKAVNTVKETVKAQKKIEIMEQCNTQIYKMGPAYQKSLDAEIDQIMEIIKNESVPGDDPTEQFVCNQILTVSMRPFRKDLTLLMTKRIQNIATNLLVRIYCHPKPPKRESLVKVLGERGLHSLRKSDKNTYFIGTCSSYENYDNLIAMGEISIDDALVHVKPMHLTSKVKKEVLLHKNIYKKYKVSEDILLQNPAQDDFADLTEETEMNDDDDVCIVEDNYNKVIDLANDEKNIDFSSDTDCIINDVNVVNDQIAAVADEINTKDDVGIEQEGNGESGDYIVTDEIGVTDKMGVSGGIGEADNNGVTGDNQENDGDKVDNKGNDIHDYANIDLDNIDENDLEDF